MISMALNNCLSNYGWETTFQAPVCSLFLGENGVIECSTQQINDMIFVTWQLVLIIVGKRGLLHTVCKH